MEDFFNRVETRTHAWPPGRRDLHWLVLPDPGLARELCGSYRALTEQPGLCPVRPEWLHLTVLHAGAQDAATGAEINKLVDEVTKRAADIPPYGLTLSRPDIGTMAIEVKGYPGAPHRALWEMTWEAQQAVVGERWPLIPTMPYPHLALAYAGADGHLAVRRALKMVLSDLPGPVGPVTMPVTTLSLVAEWHTHEEIRWDVLTEVSLGG
ncbi:2'-5' RNA ligase family protein [Streptomyces sp. MMS24-I29]|uniref:2'-5' RNA ligase family protein n=1 Tax=Streptomyces sp. MMS24-I29 TaxID=3351480 RepID=UPI003C7CE95C